MEKTKEVIIVIALLVLAVILCEAVFGVNDKPKDLRDFLFQPPNSIYQEYGYSEETLLFYNIITLREMCQKYGLRISALELQVVGLLKPNEVVE